MNIYTLYLLQGVNLYLRMSYQEEIQIQLKHIPTSDVILRLDKDHGSGYIHLLAISIVVKLDAIAPFIRDHPHAM